MISEPQTAFGMVARSDYDGLASIHERRRVAAVYLLGRCLELEDALRALADRCDGPEGVRADGSNVDTLAARAALGDFQEVEP